MSSFPNDPRKNPGIKRAYYPLPEENPDTWRCIEIHIPDGAEYHELLITALKSLTIWFNYMRDPSHRGKVIADRFAYALNLPELGCDMNCEELTACLQPLFDALTDALAAQTAQLQQLLDTQAANAAAERELPQSAVSDEICGGATGAVEFMHGFNNDLYNKAELSTVDNANEAAARIIAAIPLFNELPFDDLFALSNTMFENVVVTYNADYADIKTQMICDLSCLVVDNGNVFDYDIWNDWLVLLGTKYPANAGAKLFSKYAPAHQTFLNQIAAFFNKNASLQSYFDSISTAWAGGLENPAVCSACTCGLDVVAPANVAPPGTDSGFDVVSGTDYMILAPGTWDSAGGPTTADGDGTTDPITIAPTVSRWSLVYRVGTSGAWLFAGTSNVITPGSTGRVYFCMNDATAGFSDNSGSLTVHIEQL